jgi:hypothetical protein
VISSANDKRRKRSIALVDASGGKGRGNADGADDAWTNTHVAAGNALTG